MIESFIKQSRLLKRLFLGASHHLPVWVCTAYADPYQQAIVTLEGLGEPIEVTRNHVVVELLPLLVAMYFPGHGHLAALRQAQLRLCITEVQPAERCLGYVSLQADSVLALPEGEIGLFRTTHVSNFCLSPVRLTLHYWHERLKLLVDRDPRNVFKMPPLDLFCLWMLYCIPKPLGFVSYQEDRQANLFPVDYLGCIASGHYLVSISTARPFIPLIKKSRKLAISTLPLDQSEMIKPLSRHHRVASVDWNEVPLSVTPSKQYGIPTPSNAITVREVEVEQVYDLPAHTLFVTKTTHLEQRHAGLHVCLIQRIYHHLLIQ